MPVLANPRLIEEFEKHGASDVVKCYNCGNCTATCPFSTEPFLLPRKSMRYLQIGLESRLRSNLEPWLCYYCGECSDECPRDAEPGETMMSMRRWLIGQYDLLGVAKLFMRSAFAEIAFVVMLALLAGAGFLGWGFAHGRSLADYQGFMPAHDMHVVDLALGLFFVGLVALNAVRMWYFTMGSGPGRSVGVGLYLKHLLLLPWHFFTQRRYSQCSHRMPWLLHLVLALSYVTMLALIMFFLHAMQAEKLEFGAHLPGYLAAIGLIVGAVYVISGRLRQNRTAVKHSHHTDWVFIILLLYVAVTGIAQHILHRAGLESAANIVYMLHMMGVVPWMVRFPFSKWSHMVYRPLAMYFARLQAEAALTRARADVRPAVAVQPTA